MKQVPTNKIFFQSWLPKVSDADRLLLKADNGLPIPKKNLITSIPQDYLDGLDNLTGSGSNAGYSPINTQPDTSNYQPPNTDLAVNPLTVQPMNPQTPMPPPRQPEKAMWNAGEFAVGALGTLDALLPNERIHKPIVRPLNVYNPHQYGTGSQALADGGMIEAKSGNWIKGAVNPAHKGYCTPMTKSTCTPRRKAFAETMKKHHGFHENGGIIEQMMAEGGGLSRAEDYGSKSHPYPSVSAGEFAGPHRSYPIPSRADAVDALRLAHLHGNSAVIAKVHEKYPGLGEAASGIHINPKNKGKFNATKKATGKSTEELTHSSNPVTKKRAIFAQNAKKWHHGADGIQVPNNLALSNKLPLDTHNSQLEDDLGGSVISQIFASGGSLTSGKAKEMLRDGTAQGHKLTPKQKRYFGYIAGGGTPKADEGLAIQGAGDPIQDTKKKPKVKPGGPQPVTNPTDSDQYYGANAKFAYYNNVLKDKLKAKNPEQYNNYMSGLVQTRRSAGDDSTYVANSNFNDYLSPDEVKTTLGDKQYQDYLESLKSVNSYNVKQGQRPLYGTKEDQSVDPSTLNFGKRFASLQANSNFDLTQKHNDGTQSTYTRRYNYDPKGGLTYNEMGDINLRPSIFNSPDQIASNTYKMGGRIMESGGTMEPEDIQTHWGGEANIKSYNPYDGGTTQFSGDSHAEGGIGMSFQGNPVEVEGGETAAKDSQGNLNVFGNMKIPGTNTKFKTASKEIADKEIKFGKLKDKGTTLLNLVKDPSNNYQQLAFNSGQVMAQGGDIAQKELAKRKQQLADLQNAMLDTANQFGIDPQHLSEGRIRTAKKGIKIPKAADGDFIGEPGNLQPNGSVIGGPGDGINDPTRADRNNNPGNIHLTRTNAAELRKLGVTKADKDGFAIFPNRQAGSTAMHNLLVSKTYANKPIDEAIHTWTGGNPYKYNLPADMKNADGSPKKISELTDPQRFQLQNIMAKGEGTRYGTAIPDSPVVNNSTPPQIPFEKFGLPTAPGFSTPVTSTPNNPTPPRGSQFQEPNKKPIPTNAMGLEFANVAPELYAAATNHERPVHAQKFIPELYEPYQVSFQDQLNQNQASFNSISKVVGPSNVAALGSLAGEKYSADSSVKANEFRTNQGIYNDIVNKNIGLTNQAQEQNLQIADQQYVRQEGANAKTREENQMIVNSLSSKYAQNQFENRRLKAYETLYNYRFQNDPEMGKAAGFIAANYNPDAIIDYTGGRGVRQANQGQPGYENTDPTVRTIRNYDAKGNLKNYREVDDSSLNDQYRELKTEMERRKLPLMQVPQLNASKKFGGIVKKNPIAIRHFNAMK